MKLRVVLYDNPAIEDEVVHGQTFDLLADEIGVLPNGFISFVRSRGQNGATQHDTTLLLHQDAVLFIRRIE